MTTIANEFVEKLSKAAYQLKPLEKKFQVSTRMQDIIIKSIEIEHFSFEDQKIAYLLGIVMQLMT